MVKGFTITLGAGLLLLSLAALGATVFPIWYVWLDLIAATAAVSAGVFKLGEPRSKSEKSRQVEIPIIISIGMFAIWIVAVAIAIPNWLAWWNFGFAVAFMLLGIVASAGISQSEAIYPPEEIRESLRKNGWSNRRYFGGAPDLLSYRGWPFFGLGYYGLGDESDASQLGKDPRDYQRPDARLEEEVNEILSHQSKLDAREVVVHVQQGNVSLEGSVASRRDRRLAKSLAESVWGVKDVTNSLAVKGRPSRRDLTEAA